MIARKFNHGDINKRTINQQIAFGRFILTVGRHVSVDFNPMDFSKHFYNRNFSNLSGRAFLSSAEKTRKIHWLDVGRFFLSVGLR